MGTFVSGSVHGSLSPVGIMVMLVGCITFLLCSFMAISQTNAKRVLAYSTIANLGLITACAGVGNAARPSGPPSSCILFHARCQESLLFLCVGTAEHHIGSRDIEDMDAAVRAHARASPCFMMLGIMRHVRRPVRHAHRQVGDAGVAS